MANYDPFFSNPANKAMPYLNKIPETIEPLYQPYISSGKQALSDVMGQYSQLINDPNAVLNKFGSDYQKSPSYDWNYQQALKAANSAAAAGGYLGTPQNQQIAATQAGHVADEDFWNYLQHVMGLYGTGLSGLGHVSDVGYQASSSEAEDLARNLESQSSLAYLGQENQNKANSDFLSSLLSGTTSFLSGLLGGSNNGSTSGNNSTSFLGNLAPFAAEVFADFL